MSIANGTAVTFCRCDGQIYNRLCDVSSGYCLDLKHYYESSAVAEMGDRGHNRHGPKKGAAVPLSRELKRRLVQCGLGQGLLP